MSDTKAILDALFEMCPSEWFDRRIDGRRPNNNRIRSTLCHPRETLAALRRRFGEDELIVAKVAEPNAFGELQIVPALCQTGGAVIALRERAAEPPFDLLTARGSLLGDRHPVLSALADGRRAGLVDETGMMLAARRCMGLAAG